MLNICRVKVFIFPIKNGRRITISIKTTTNFGTKVKVCSEIDVAAWKIETSNPTIREASSSGPTVINT